MDFYSWTFGDDWPNQGEIDIIEGVNLQTKNDVTLHTSNGCSTSGTGQTGTSVTKNCFVNAPNQQNNQGCGNEVCHSRQNIWVLIALTNHKSRTRGQTHTVLASTIMGVVYTPPSGTQGGSKCGFSPATQFPEMPCPETPNH